MKLVLAAALCALAVQQPKPPEPAKAELAPADVARIQRPAYPLHTCPVSGESLDSMGGAYDHVVQGRLVRLCCKSCVPDVDQNPAAVLAKIDKAVIAEQKPTYPLDACPISDHALDATAVDHVSGTRLVRFCCPKCVAAFDKDPKPVMDRIDAALIQKQLATYPLDTCVVSGEPLSENEPKEYLYGTRLVRLCCKMCVKSIEKDPAKYLAMLDAAAKKKSGDAKAGSGLKGN